MIIKKFKKNRKIVCYIEEFKNKFTVKTGKPSDSSCISWQYDCLPLAENTAAEYFQNRTNL